jgi:hypothetical protein
MATPAFVYAFDNLGPESFAELCGKILGSRYKGFGLFVLGGVGPDGGIDAEIDTTFGLLETESHEALLNSRVSPGETIIFQFKHKVVGRIGGQSRARQQLLSLYKCRSGFTCELHRRLIEEKQPSFYVLVTNVEVNSQFRSKFVDQCRSENPEIKHYQVIGLDELENWVTMETRLRHLYLPTIFGPPQFNLRIALSEGHAVFFDDGTALFGAGPHPKHILDSVRPADRLVDLLLIAVYNVGIVPSYIGSIGFKFLVNEETRIFYWQRAHQALPEIQELNQPGLGTPIEPGRCHLFRFPFTLLRELTGPLKEAFPVEILVYDEIENAYRTAIPEGLGDRMVNC